MRINIKGWIMIDMSASKSAYNSFDFNFKTGSGDNISLSMYDNKEISVESMQDGNMSMQSFSLSHSYGYEFEYSGNGLDENDKKEIAAALEELQPSIDTFMSNINDSGIPSPKSILNLSREMSSQLPKADTTEKQDAIHDGLLNLFDNTLKDYFPNEDVLKGAKSLFDRINEQMKSFSLYV